MLGGSEFTEFDKLGLKSLTPLLSLFPLDSVAFYFYRHTKFSTSAKSEKLNCNISTFLCQICGISAPLFLCVKSQIESEHLKTGGWKHTYCAQLCEFKQGIPTKERK